MNSLAYYYPDVGITQSNSALETVSSSPFASHERTPSVSGSQAHGHAGLSSCAGGGREGWGGEGAVGNPLHRQSVCCQWSTTWELGYVHVTITEKH